jgi:hypothetical protein
VAQELDLRTADLPAADWRPAAGLLIVAAAVAAALTGWSFVLLAGGVAAGAGLTYLSGLPLRAEERVAFGAVIGAVVVASLVLLLALAAGLTLRTVLAGLALALAASLPGWWRGRRRLGTELAEAALRWRRLEPWPLWCLLALAWPYTLIVLAGAYGHAGGALLSGQEGVYSDWAAHLTYAGSFAYGANFPPQFPIDPGHRMAYPFLVDLWAAALVPLGASLTSALVLTSGLLGLAFPAVMYQAGLRLTGSRTGAALGVLVFTLGGGLGFARVLPAIAWYGLQALPEIPLATQDLSANYVWLNPVLAWLIPQRSALFGFSLTLLIMAALWIALRSPGRAWAPFAFAGLVAGLTPLVHPHAYGTVVALAACWTVLSPRREWSAFYPPALALGLPVTAWLLGGGAAHPHLQLWWMADSDGHHDGPVWFWLENTGLFLPALAAAFAWRGLLPRRLGAHLAPIWLWFLVPNVVVFENWDWDNTKFFAYWSLFGSILVGALLARLLRAGGGARAAGLALAVVLMLSGGIDLARSLAPALNTATFTDAAGVKAAAWVREHTDRRAVFVVAPDHNEPVPTLGGRRVVVGYGAWLWTYGVSDWSQRTDDVERMLRGDPGTPELLREYGVDYVVIGPAELDRYGANRAYWDRAAQVVYANGEYTVYRVP